MLGNHRYIKMIKFDPTQLQNWLSKPSSKGELNSQNGQQQIQKSAPASLVTLSGATSSTSFSYFHQTVQKRVQQSISVPQDPKPNKLEQAAIEQRDKRSDASSSAILGFITNRLKIDKADGATQEQLQSRIEAGLKGFEQGYEEASGILSDMGLLEGDVESDISLTAQKVKEGLFELANEYLGESQSVIEKPASLNQSDDSAEESVPPARIGEALFQSLQSKESRSFEFELETRDGDTIKINASAFLGASVESGSGRFSSQGQGNGNSYSGSYAYSYSEVVSQQQFSLSIDGDLDEDELEAINALLEKINSLSADFYDGDMQEAINKAMELEYDSSEISGFALDLSQSTSVKAVEAYQSEQASLNPGAAALRELEPLGNFAADLKGEFAKTEDLFAHPRDLLSDLFQKMDLLNKPEEQDYSIDFSSFSTSIIEQWSSRLELIRGPKVDD